ncbi:MAG: DsbA family protein [Rhodopseudomonas sp.]|uniref:DsbA family protein n=1 Tax=Rhodopseudomonas sp. TaxID=1078 RepID=UPI0017D45845|nr:DsbA family protein [Rhodopseudomonas sp.]NVN86008.1 DsbA family protein [Rhodopseudomonas sp.]
MTEPADPAAPLRAQFNRRSRRETLGLLAASAVLLGLEIAPVAARSQTQSDDGNVLTEAKVLRDPEIPVAGNPKGDITIVEFFDYNCPYCRKLAPDLHQVVAEDGKIRLVLKDWPILGPVSVYASRLALATKYQDKFIEAHDALIGLDVRLTEAGVRDRLAKAGIDIDRAVRDLETNTAAIAAILKRADDQAQAFGFQGTPAFIIGKFRVPGPLTKEQFALAIRDARKAAAKK